MRHIKVSLKARLRAGGTVALVILLAFCFSERPRAQRGQEAEVKVTGVASRPTADGSAVTISADSNLSRAQTWQDSEGFHVVLPRGRTDLRNSGAPRGVRVNRVGDSLEFVVPVKPGARVTVQPRFNRLDLFVSGGTQDGGQRTAGEGTGTAWADESAEGREAGEARERGGRRRRDDVSASHAQTRGAASANSGATRAGDAQPQAPSASATQANGANAGNLAAGTGANPANVNPSTSDAAAASGAQAAPTAPVNAQNAPASAADGAADNASKQASPHTSSSLTASILVATLSVAGLCVGLFVYRRRRGLEVVGQGGDSKAVKKAAKAEKKAKAAEEKQAKKQAKEEAKEAARAGDDRRKGGDRRMIERGTPDRRQTNVKPERVGLHHPQPAAESGAEKSLMKPAARAVAAPSVPSVLFGSYRIDQEIAKLAAGEPHAIDVLASRASDDRRAVETSLIKVMRSDESGEDGRRRARLALEEYGFVARQSAALLLAPDAYERASAARVLGEIRSVASLPFLLEALYDPESVVRQEVVSSLGSLRLPRAIGPLIDMARRYPEMPADSLRPALNACSVETLDLGTSHHDDEPQFTFSPGSFTGEIMGLEPPEAVEVLPEWLEDDSLADALERLNSVDVEARTVAAQSLAQFQVQRSVDALAAMSATDREPVVRAAAVTSLGVVNHESVFAPVLMALADDAREVRAAAARSLSRLSFNRADAYVRVIETSDAQTLRSVARACVKAGLAAQAVDRLTSTDRRQAYESFALLSLVVKSGEVAPALDAIANHADEEVRLSLLKLVLIMGRPVELVEPLRRLASRERIPARVRASLLEAVSRIEQAGGAGQRDAVAPAAGD